MLHRISVPGFINKTNSNTHAVGCDDVTIIFYSPSRLSSPSPVTNSLPWHGDKIYGWPSGSFWCKLIPLLHLLTHRFINGLNTTFRAMRFIISYLFRCSGKHFLSVSDWHDDWWRIAFKKSHKIHEFTPVKDASRCDPISSWKLLQFTGGLKKIALERGIFYRCKCNIRIDLHTLPL